MRSYELVLILRPDLDKNSYEELREKVSSLLSKEEGKLSSWQIWKEKQKFSYPLRLRGAEKKKFTEGTYILCSFLLSPSKMRSLKYTLDLEERIIRYLIVNKEAK
ncbi:MAG: 30S ribosomal protein S6 [Candidatus Omnitrophica bacterium]|nr:30S ribosomal protein S6 [Candidatus Omnitrophota bacterium]